ncbi:MAG: ATP-binding protein [Verrucomicrobia bacterium]|nr:ATP-binding protein [Verrucomicrobiota bacterium]
MSAPPPAERREAWGFLLVFVFLAAGIALGGLRYFQHRQADARSSAHTELETIADLKIQQIVNWRKERLTDANLILGNPSLALEALNILDQPESARTMQMFTGWLDLLLQGSPFERALLLDDKLNLRLVYPEGASRALTEDARRSAEEALRTQQLVVTDLHGSENGRQVYLDFVVPLVVRRVGTNDNALAAGLDPSRADRSAGVLVLKLNAHDFLFPLVQTWPTASSTAETLLVRREGQEVLYLNELRHQPGTAMNLRRPLSGARLPAAMGLRGEKVLGEGVDYRGVRVVAAVRPVPDTPWVMVAKVDEAELYAPLRREALAVGTVILALLLASALAVTLLWRQHNERFLQAQLAVEREQRATAERAELTLREAEARIRKMLVMAPVPMCHLNRDGMLAFRNERFVQVFGYTVEDVPTLAEWWQLAFPDPQYRQWAIERWDEAVRHAAAGERDIAAVDYKVTCNNGDERMVEISGIMLGEELLVTFIDVTERKLAQETMRKFNGELELRVRQRTAELEASMKELDAFAYSVSHDLRAPLRHVSGFAELLRASAGPRLPDQSRHYLEEITGSATQMGRLIDDLLRFSRMGRTELRQERLELAGLVEESIQQLGSEINGRNILWKKNPLPAVQADPALLRQVLVNLLANAIKYTRPRDPAMIEIGCASGNGQETVIFVRDNGVGFDMQYGDKLFGVFQRLHAEEEFEGTGVGLANVRRIIARHGGRTWAEGKVNEGATFYFSLPSHQP